MHYNVRQQQSRVVESQSAAQAAADMCDAHVNAAAPCCMPSLRCSATRTTKQLMLEQLAGCISQPLHAAKRTLSARQQEQIKAVLARQLAGLDFIYLRLMEVVD